MEVEEIQTQGPPSSKFPRLIANGGRSADPTTTVKLGHHGEQDGDLSHLRGWHHHSRIIRVSRASGGKDRHSKVLTSKGLRDRRVRLSVSTAIQFYDIQDRLGYDQPSKAVEWLIKAASDSISELPSLSSNFPDTPKQLSDEKRGSEELDEYHHHQHGQQQHQQQHQQQQHNLSLSKSACSSTSETSKGSGGLSLSRTEIRVNRVKKSRERARERTAKDKEKETPATGSQQQQPHQEISLTPMSQSSSFTELLTGPGPHGGRGHQWISASPSSSMDYFQQHQQQQSGFVGIPGQTISIPQFTISGEHSHHNHHHHQHQQELQHFSFDHINLIPVTPASEYNLNFTISPSSGLAGYRGTLQSNNTASLLPQHHQRFSSTTTSPTVDGSNNSSNNMPFFLSPSPMENHHHHHHQQQLHIGQFPSGLQLYGDGTTRHSPDHKGKVKN